jgi:hypothetical protein
MGIQGETTGISLAQQTSVSGMIGKLSCKSAGPLVEHAVRLKAA